MTFSFEQTLARPEIRKGLAGTIRHWPKIDGRGNIAVSATATDNTYVLYHPNGQTILGSGNLAVTTVAGVSRFDIPVPALTDLLEDYFAVVSWLPAASGLDSTEVFQRVDQLQFDCVLQPWGDSRLSLNNMLDRVPTIGARLQRQIDVLDPTGALGFTLDRRASQLAHAAHSELFRRIRTKMQVERHSLNRRFDVEGAPVYPAEFYTRPRLIVDRQMLTPIELAIALAMTFEADLAMGLDQAEAAKMSAYWYDAASRLFVELGALQYDFSEDRVPDREIQKLGGVSVTRRVQAR